MTKLEAIRVRCKAASGEPWTRKDGVVFGLNIDETGIEFDRTDDADFIAHSRTDIPLLLAVVEAAKAVSESNASNATHKNCYCIDCELDRALLALEQPEAT